MPSCFVHWRPLLVNTYNMVWAFFLIWLSYVNFEMLVRTDSLLASPLRTLLTFLSMCRPGEAMVTLTGCPAVSVSVMLVSSPQTPIYTSLKCLPWYCWMPTSLLCLQSPLKIHWWPPKIQRRRKDSVRPQRGNSSSSHIISNVLSSQFSSPSLCQSLQVDACRSSFPSGSLCGRGHQWQLAATDSHASEGLQRLLPSGRRRGQWEESGRIIYKHAGCRESGRFSISTSWTPAWSHKSQYRDQSIDLLSK